MRVYVFPIEMPCTDVNGSTYSELLETLGFPDIFQGDSLKPSTIAYALATGMFTSYRVMDFLEPEQSRTYIGTALSVEALETHLASLYAFQNSPRVAESLRIYEYLIKLTKKGYTVFRY